MADDDCLTEELVVRHGGQYDPELLQRLTLSGLRLARLGAGLARCTALRVLDLARNKLQHLDGVEVCASLERLLVARNELARFGFVACARRASDTAAEFPGANKRAPMELVRCYS